MKAIVRSSANRVAHIKAANADQDSRNDGASRIAATTSQIADIDLSQDEMIVANESNRPNQKSKQVFSSTSDTNSNFSNLALLPELRDVSDIDASVDPKCRQREVLDKLQTKWHDIASNLEHVLSHLKECTKEVATASISCMEILNSDIGETCDRVDEELKAMYYLITKSEELTTKLSVANTFREEIKTLKKSVDTLEQLYKNMPQT